MNAAARLMRDPPLGGAATRAAGLTIIDPAFVGASEGSVVAVLGSVWVCCLISSLERAVAAGVDDVDGPLQEVDFVNRLPAEASIKGESLPSATPPSASIHFFFGSDSPSKPL